MRKFKCVNNQLHQNLELLFVKGITIYINSFHQNLKQFSKCRGLCLNSLFKSWLKDSHVSLARNVLTLSYTFHRHSEALSHGLSVPTTRKCSSSGIGHKSDCNWKPLQVVSAFFATPDAMANNLHPPPPSILINNASLTMIRMLLLILSF